MITHIKNNHNNEIIPLNDSIHDTSVGELTFGGNNNNDGDNNDDPYNINNDEISSSTSLQSTNSNNNLSMSLDITFMSIDDAGSDHDNDVGEVLDSDDRTWANDMIDDDNSDATHDYIMDEQCRAEETKPCDTYEYTIPENVQVDLSYIRGAHNRIFYEQEHNNPNDGICGLAHRAASHSNSSEGVVDIEDADLLLDISESLFSKSKSEQKKHIKSLKKVFRLFSHAAPQSSVSIPLDIKSANDVCLENKYAIIKNLPHPEPFLTECGHVGISLEDLLDHIMAAGEELSFIDSVQTNNVGLNATPAAADLRQRIVESLGCEIAKDTLIGQLILWSDSFLRCFSRQRENSIWLLVVQVCSGKRYTLAFGRSKLDHSAVVERYMRELDSIRSGKRRYYGREGMKSVVNTAFDLIIYLADTPERNSLLGTMNLGLYGLRSKWAGLVNSKYLPSCDSCFSKMVRIALGELEINESYCGYCSRCCGWDYTANTRAIQYDKTSNTKYPSASSDSNDIVVPPKRAVSERHLLPVSQSFEWLMTVLRFAFNELVVGPWSKTGMHSAQRYLQTCGISQKTQDKLLECVKRYDDDELTLEEAEVEFIPYILRSGYEIKIFLDTGMHLICHGIIGTLIELAESVLAEHKLWTSFQNFANPILSQIADMRIDWCKMKTLPNTNWLAEDCLGFGRIMSYVFGLFFERYDVVSARDDTTTECIIRLREIFSSFHVVLYLLMSREKESKEEIDRHIKIFLSCCHRFCEVYYHHNTEEFWCTKGNFLSLLNLPDQIEYFGNLHLYYEGIFEAAIQPAKKELKYVRKNPTSLIPAMRKLHKKDSIRRIRERLDISLAELGISDEEDDDNDDDVKRYQGCRIYRSLDEVAKKFSDGMCVSGFINNNFGDPGNVFIPYSVGKTKFKLLTYQFSESRSGTGHCGLPYFACQPAPMLNVDQIFNKQDLGYVAESFCLLLPYSQEEGTSAYSLIENKWNILADEITLAKPRLEKLNNLFN